MKQLNQQDITLILNQLKQVQQELIELKRSTRLDLLTMEEICEMTKFSRKHIYFMMNEGRFPRQIKIGGSSRWKRTDYESWLEAQVAQTAA
ncbi:helix-turn-helix transcriptional regulator [Thiomicrospira sp.]|uniref:helix-turn-helix transcriptional regulator n=1 Tax=Thiomicrospira sp. TaxID=935 RepID=UPI002F925610